MSNSFHQSNNYKIKSSGYLSGSHVNFNGGIQNNKSYSLSNNGSQVPINKSYSLSNNGSQVPINKSYSLSNNGSQVPINKHYDNDHHHHNHNHMYYNYYGFNGGYNYYPFYYYNEIPYILDTDILSNKYDLSDDKCYDIVKKKEMILERGTTKDCEKWCNSIDENNNLIFSNMSPSSNNRCQCFIKTGKKLCS